jgi:hypothetical protein
MREAALEGVRRETLERSGGEEGNAVDMVLADRVVEEIEGIVVTRQQWRQQAETQRYRSRKTAATR